MKLTILKWLSVLTISTFLYGSSNTSEEIADCCAPPAPKSCPPPAPKSCPPPAPAKSCCPPKPCCVPAKIKPMPPCEVCQDPCCPPMAVYNRNVNPPAHCMGQCANDFFVTGAFLWWLSDEADFSLGFKQKTPYVNSTPSVPGSAAIGEVLGFNYQWDPGFRIGLGWQSHTAEGWDVYLDWTWYKNKTTQNESSATAANGVGIVPYWGLTEAGQVFALYGNMKADWRILYNMISLELGRDFFVSCALSLRPFLSVEGGWIHRKWDVNYFNPNIATTLFGSDTYSSKSNYWGVGPKAGLGGNWWLGKGFKFFGNLSGSLLSGKVSKNSASFFHVESTFTVLNNQNNNLSTKPFFRVVPHLQAIVGAAYDICFCCEKYRFGISAGWEVNEFWNVPMAVYPDRNTNSDGTGSNAIFNREDSSHNLALSGLTAEAKFDF